MEKCLEEVVYALIDEHGWDLDSVISQLISICGAHCEEEAIEHLLAIVDE